MPNTEHPTLFSPEKIECWSFSRLDSYESCPYKFYSKYVLGEEDASNSWSDNGSHCHDILEMVGKGEIDVSDAANYYYHNIPNLEFPTMKQDYTGKLIHDCLLFFEKLPELDLGFDKLVGVERDFEIDIQGEMFRGFIDAEEMTDEGIVNRDYKTSSMSGFSGKKLNHKFKQLYIYSASTKEHFGEWPKYLEFYMIRGQKKIRREFSKKEYQESIDWALGVIEKIHNETEWEKRQDYFFCSNICGVRSCEFNGGFIPSTSMK